MNIKRGGFRTREMLRNIAGRSRSSPDSRLLYALARTVVRAKRGKSQGLLLPLGELMSPSAGVRRRSALSSDLGTVSCVEFCLRRGAAIDCAPKVCGRKSSSCARRRGKLLSRWLALPTARENSGEMRLPECPRVTSAGPRASSGGVELPRSSSRRGE